MNRADWAIYNALNSRSRVVLDQEPVSLPPLRPPVLGFVLLAGAVVVVVAAFLLALTATQPSAPVERPEVRVSTDSPDASKLVEDLISGDVQRKPFDPWGALR